jgi:hypothetical protein
MWIPVRREKKLPENTPLNVNYFPLSGSFARHLYITNETQPGGHRMCEKFGFSKKHKLMLLQVIKNSEYINLSAEKANSGSALPEVIMGKSHTVVVRFCCPSYL